MQDEIKHGLREETALESTLDVRKTYCQPILKCLGDLRAITLGASSGTFTDSPTPAGIWYPTAPP